MKTRLSYLSALNYKDSVSNGSTVPRINVSKLKKADERFNITVMLCCLGAVKWKMLSSIKGGGFVITLNANLFIAFVWL